MDTAKVTARCKSDTRLAPFAYASRQAAFDAHDNDDALECFEKMGESYWVALVRVPAQLEYMDAVYEFTGRTGFADTEVGTHPGRPVALYSATTEDHFAPLVWVDAEGNVGEADPRALRS